MPTLSQWNKKKTVGEIVEYMFNRDEAEILLSKDYAVCGRVIKCIKDNGEIEQN